MNPKKKEPEENCCAMAGEGPVKIIIMVGDCCDPSAKTQPRGKNAPVGKTTGRKTKATKPKGRTR